MNVLDLFSGIGGFSLGLERAGMHTVAFCEIDPYCRAVLLKHWPDVPCYDDVRTVTADRLRADGISVDLICGGFPCQDASIANTSGAPAGSGGERTGLFRDIVRLADELDCPAVMENVPALLVRGFGDVLGALAEIGFDAEWDCISAREVGAPHLRDRLWLVAYPGRARRQGFESYNGVLIAARAALTKHGDATFGAWDQLAGRVEPLRGGDGLSVAMERRRLHALGNAVVPQIPEIIGRAIMKRTTCNPA